VKKKSSFSDQEYVNLEPNEEDIAVKEGARYLPIDVVERDLDRWVWGTENFTWQFFRDNRGQQGISASIVLVIPWKGDDGKVIQRRISGGCNFAMTNYAPNSHFVATAKSECVKNAASDLGRKFGRGLNEGLSQEGHDESPVEKPRTKMQPDEKIKAQYNRAVEVGDQTVIKVLTSVYEFNTQENGA
jgi:hypothetical protein